MPKGLLYEDVRDQIKTGDLLIWKKDHIKFFSNLFLSIVRLFTRSEFAHTAIAWKVGNRLFVIEATVPQVRIYPVSNYDLFYHIPMGLENDPKTKELLDEAMSWLLEKVGLDYSIKNALRGYFGLTIDDESEWQCAELCNLFYRRLGLNFEDNFTPTKLVNCILEPGEKVIRLIKNKL